MVRLNVPLALGRQRKKLVNRVKELAEEARISIRNIRRDANKQADDEQADKILTEDDLATCKDEILALTKRSKPRSTSLPTRNRRRSSRSDDRRAGRSGAFPQPSARDGAISRRDHLDRGARFSYNLAVNVSRAISSVG